MKGPKFEIGQKIKFINDPDSKAGKVVGIAFNDGKWFYSIPSKTVNVAEEKIEVGIKSGFEDEFVKVKDVEVKEEE